MHHVLPDAAGDPHDPKVQALLRQTEGLLIDAHTTAVDFAQGLHPEAQRDPSHPGHYRAGQIANDAALAYARSVAEAGMDTVIIPAAAAPLPQTWWEHLSDSAPVTVHPTPAPPDRRAVTLSQRVATADRSYRTARAAAHLT